MGFINYKLIEPELGNTKSGKAWNNVDRHMAYELSPYDVTLVMDIDYFPFTDNLRQLLEVEHDFIISKNNKKYFVDVKTRTKKFHTRTLEMVKQFHSKKIDIYISVFLIRDKSNFQIKILGWCNRNDIIKINRIENNGYLDNYVLYDKELKDIKQLINYL